MMRRPFLSLDRLIFERIARPLLFRAPTQQMHEQVLRMQAWLDDHTWTHPLLRWAHDLAFIEQPLTVGGVVLHHPLMLAAGFVKGQLEGDAAVIPGWRSLPLLVGAVEFGSFTRWPRTGNLGTVIWRDEATQSTQNRVGLKNPGAEAAADLLAVHREHLPPIFGINVAVSPGVTDPAQECREILEAIGCLSGSRSVSVVVHAEFKLPQHRGRFRQSPDRNPRP